MWKMSMPTLHGSKQVWQSLKTKSTPTIQQAINSRILTFASSLNQYKHSTRRQSTSINNQSPDLLESLPCTCATIPTVERSTRRLLTWELTCAGTLGTSPIFAVGPAVSGDSPGQDILRKISFFSKISFNQVGRAAQTLQNSHRGEKTQMWSLWKELFAQWPLEEAHTKPSQQPSRWFFGEQVWIILHQDKS